MVKIPKSAAADSKNSPKKVISLSSVHDFKQYSPCWRIGNFDMDGPWGLKSLLGDFIFHANDDLEMFVLSLNNNSIINAIDKLNNKHFDSIDDFWDKFSGIVQDNIPIDIIKLVNGSLARNYFFEKIFPKLKTFEKTTWEELDKATHDNGKSSNHNDSIQDLTKKAQDRLDELKYSDRSEIYSLRLENKVRIFGFRELNYLDIIWVDPNHEVYKSDKKHT